MESLNPSDRKKLILLCLLLVLCVENAVSRPSPYPSKGNTSLFFFLQALKHQLFTGYSSFFLSLLFLPFFSAELFLKGNPDASSICLVIYINTLGFLIKTGRSRFLDEHFVVLRPNLKSNLD